MLQVKDHVGAVGSTVWGRFEAIHGTLILDIHVSNQK